MWIWDLTINKTNKAVLSVAASNGAEMYGGIREGAGTAGRYRSDDWSSMVSTSDVMNALRTSLGAEAQGSGLLVDGSFQIDDLQTNFVNMEGGNLNNDNDG